MKNDALPYRLLSRSWRGSMSLGLITRKKGMVGRLKIGWVVVLTLGLGLLTGCSSAPTSPALEVETDPSDPFENVNRKIYLFII